MWDYDDDYYQQRQRHAELLRWSAYGLELEDYESTDTDESAAEG